MSDIKKVFIITEQDRKNVSKTEYYELPITNIVGFFTDYDQAVDFVNKMNKLSEKDINSKEDFISVDFSNKYYDIGVIRNENEILKENLKSLDEYQTKSGYERTVNIFNMLLNNK